MRLRSRCLICLILFQSCNPWRSFWGDHPLGNNLSLLEGDRIEDRVIVYCSARSAGACYTGIQVLPKKNDQYKNGRYAQYVSQARSNEDWVIAEVHDLSDQTKQYWLMSKQFDPDTIDCGRLSCDSLLQTFLLGPFSSEEFASELSRRATGFGSVGDDGSFF